MLTGEVTGTTEHLGPVNSPGVGVRHIQLAAHRVGSQVVAVGGVVAVDDRK